MLDLPKWLARFKAQTAENKALSEEWEQAVALEEGKPISERDTLDGIVVDIIQKSWTVDLSLNRVKDMSN